MHHKSAFLRHYSTEEARNILTNCSGKAGATVSSRRVPVTRSASLPKKHYRIPLHMFVGNTNSNGTRHPCIPGTIASEL